MPWAGRSQIQPGGSLAGKEFLRGFIDLIVLGRPSRVIEAQLHVVPDFVQYLCMGAGQVALQIILDLEHARADRPGDGFADILVERAFGRGLSQLEGPFDGELDLPGRDGIAIFAHATEP